MKYNIEISKILDKHLPANGVGTERELLRMNIHRDMCDLINKLPIADEREQAYQKFFRDHPIFRGKSIRYRGNYIFNKDEAYGCIDYYLRTGIEP